SACAIRATRRACAMERTGTERSARPSLVCPAAVVRAGGAAASRQVEYATEPVEHQVRTRVAGDLGEGRQASLTRFTDHDFGLVAHARVAILHVQRIDLGARLLLVETDREQQTLGPAVAGAEGEIADAIEDRAAFVHFERLDDVRMMPDHQIR